MSAPLWYTKRNYLHFDVPVSGTKAEKIVTSTTSVARHAFFPFISYSFQLTKLDRDTSTGKLYRKPKPREVAYSSHIDSHIYAYYANQLSNLYEQKVEKSGLHESVLAFRKLDGKSNIHFADDAFNYIRKMKECSVIALDFSKFFNTLDHRILKEEWSKLLQVKHLPKESLQRFSISNQVLDCRTR